MRRRHPMGPSVGTAAVDVQRDVWLTVSCKHALSLLSGTTCRISRQEEYCFHYSDVIMGTIASQITSLKIVYSTDPSDADQRKHQSSVSMAFVRGSHRGPAVGCFSQVGAARKWLFFLVITSLRPSDAYMRRLSNHIASDNGLSPSWRQAIIWTNAGILLMIPLRTNFS